MLHILYPIPLYKQEAFSKYVDDGYYLKNTDDNFLARFFGYKKEKIEPRLYGLKYDRELHEQLEKGVMPKLRKGQPVLGKLTKQKEGVSGNKGGKGKNENEGGGSESQEQEWKFHELRPSEIHRKPER